MKAEEKPLALRIIENSADWRLDLYAYEPRGAPMIFSLAVRLWKHIRDPQRVPFPMKSANGYMSRVDGFGSGSSIVGEN